MMRYSLIFLLFLYIPGQFLLSQTYFSYTSNTGNGASVVVPLDAKPAIESEPLSPGDEIGVFTPDGLCVGAAVWSGERNISITVWGDNIVTSETDGMKQGEEFYYRVWQKETGTVFSFVEVTYERGTGHYQTNGMNVLSSLNAYTMPEDTLIVPLEEGWNIISSNVRPFTSDITVIFRGINDPSLIVKNGDGSVYWPEADINTIGDWNITVGYYVHVGDADTLSIYGEQIESGGAVLNLREGWNILPYYFMQSVEISAALESISGELLIVKDAHGDIYWPEHGVNTIGDMQPGRGYHVYLSAPVRFSYATTGESLDKTGQGLQNVRSAATAFRRPEFYIPEYKNTGSNSVVLVQYPDGKDKDEIGVWTESGKLVGSGVVQNARSVVTVWGNNTLTGQITEGAIEGEVLSLTVWSHQLHYERALELERIENILKPGDTEETLQFVNDGIFIATAEREEDEFPGYIPNDYELAQNYPNPFNPSTQIRYSIPENKHVRLEIFSLIGQKIAVLVDEEKSAGLHTATFDATGISSGVYVYRLKAGNYVETRRMVLVR